MGSLKTRTISLPSQLRLARRSSPFSWRRQLLPKRRLLKVRGFQVAIPDTVQEGVPAISNLLKGFNLLFLLESQSNVVKAVYQTLAWRDRQRERENVSHIPFLAGS